MKITDCQNSIINISFKQLLTIFLFIASFVLFAFSAFADIMSDESNEGPNRIRECVVQDDQVVTDNLEMVNPSLFEGAKDVTLDFSNPVCAADVLSAYTAFKTNLHLANKFCQGKANVRILPSIITDMKDLLINDIKAKDKGASCVAPLVTAHATFAALTGVLAVKYGVAEAVYRDAQVCGFNWTAPNKAKFDKSKPNYKNSIEEKIREYGESDEENLSLTNQAYREFYYGGIEFEDNTGGSDICYDVMDSSSCSDRTNCTKFPRQKYYMRGFQQPNFNCKKYDIAEGQNDPLTGETVSDARLKQIREAYDCCMARSKEYICIQYYPRAGAGPREDIPLNPSRSEYQFCHVGENCVINAVTFSTEYEKNSNKGIACASTYSLCPFNFNLSGGSTICDYFKDGKKRDDGTWDMIDPVDLENETCAGKSDLRDADCKIVSQKAGKCANYCQYMNHCVQTNTSNFKYVTSISSPYSSIACLNFIGDSKNMTSVNGDLIYGSQRHFTAPIAQCVKETMENVFYNRAGHTKCASSDELPGVDGTCFSGEYVYVKGEVAPLDKKSFFGSLQDNLRTVVKLTLTMSIVFYGVSILLAMKEITKKELVMYVIKIGLIIYFALGTAWQTFFFDGVYNASEAISNIVFKIQTSNDENKRDGCQFGNVTKTFDGEVITSTSGQASTSDYPKNKEYLAMWDTLDCKLARYLGFGPEASVSNLVLLIVAGFYTGSIGIYFTVMTLIFGLFFVMICIRALHIFLSSAISIIIMVYVSPIIITLTLFSKTAEMFKSWVSNMISFVLQPIILFAYIAIMITLLDKFLIGSASFTGDPPNRVIDCRQVCEDVDGTLTYRSGTANVGDWCSAEGDVLIDPMSDSVACILTANDFAKRPGLEIFGISINVLSTFFAENAMEKIITMMKGALVMYLLLNILDDIPAIATSLVGGNALPNSKESLKKLTKDTRGFLVGIQKRGARALRKHLKRPDLEGVAKAIGERKSDKKPKDSDASGDFVSRE